MMPADRTVAGGCCADPSASATLRQTPPGILSGKQNSYFLIKCVTACSKPSTVSSNMGKIRRMAAIVRV